VAPTAQRWSWPTLALLAGGVLTGLVVAFNVPDNPVLELRRHRVAGMVLAHTGVVLLGVGLWPAVCHALLAAAAAGVGRLLLVFAGGIAAVVGVMGALVAASPTYARELLSREWGLVEPLQFFLYLLAARLCFTLADGWARGASRPGLFLLGGWLGRLSALEEIDYLGVPAALLDLAGVEGGRINGSYVGALHDMLNVAHQLDVLWPAALALAVVLAGAAWWVCRGSGAVLRELLSWRLAPAAIGGGFMAVAQFKDIDGRDSIVPFGRLLNDLLEEPCELLAIMGLNATLVLELAHVRTLDRPNRP
jgi:hypothetical protein